MAAKRRTDSLGQRLVGQRIAKMDYMFNYKNHDDEIYFGTIISYRYFGTQLFHVKYDDNDKEDMKLNEIQSVLKVYEQNRCLDNGVH